jgi:hypothetical protein
MNMLAGGYTDHKSDLGAGSILVVSLRDACPLLGFAALDLGLGATGLSEDGFFQGRHYLSSPTDQRALVVRDLFPVCSLTDGSLGSGIVSPTRDNWTKVRDDREHAERRCNGRRSSSHRANVRRHHDGWSSGVGEQTTADSRLHCALL